MQLRRKWSKKLPPNFKLRWPKIWNKHWSKKEASFMWIVWNKAIKVITRRVKMDGSIDEVCALCEREVESVIHRF
jgi:hypothetical protein